MSARAAAHPAAPAPTRFLSEAECAALTRRAIAFARDGGMTTLQIESRWTGNLRWARNQIISSGDVRNPDVLLTRDVRGAAATVGMNQLDDAGLEAAVRRAERLLQFTDELGDRLVVDTTVEPFDRPTLFFESTYAQDAAARAAAMRRLVAPAEQAGVLAAGYIEVAAHGRAVMNGTYRNLYYPYTLAQYSVTVRAPGTRGSGWAGVDWNDWARIDGETLSQIALEKCLRSRNPVALEPGRYTTILEPQAVCDLMWPFMDPARVMWDRRLNEQNPGMPFHKGDSSSDQSKIGERVIDERFSLTSDPMDPELGFVPFDIDGGVYHPAVWVDRGVLTNLGYDREYAITRLRKNAGLPFPGAFHLRVAGATATVDEMVATTKRGVLVTRFSNTQLIDAMSAMTTGYTRDGTWLVEDGKVSKAVKNFRFTDSPLYALNNVEQAGVPQRVFHPVAPVVVPALKVRDFSFTALSDAV